jgi:methenyltetrahydromethanopterin cyclohydrolase
MQTLLDQLNPRAAALCEQTVNQAELLDVRVHEIGGATVLDFAVDRPGTLQAGIRLAEICLAGLANVDITAASTADFPFPRIATKTDFPLAACMASQYAGWPFSHEKYFAMASGPARMLRGKEDLLVAYGLTGRSETAVAVFESNQLPSASAIAEFSKSCDVDPSNVSICIARTASFPGTIQVVARSVETMLHKLHELKFDLNTIRCGMGSAPLPPIATDDLTSLGWTNDAILYGGLVTLWVETTDAAIESVIDRLPSSSSPDFGKPFLNLFNRYEQDFYKIDKLLFSPAMVTIHNLTSGKTYPGGSIRQDILRTSFGM